ncbi:MAG: hypothetical protein ACWGSQ_15060 [Longimicrobiales bacterium]
MKPSTHRILRTHPRTAPLEGGRGTPVRRLRAGILPLTVLLLLGAGCRSSSTGADLLVPRPEVEAVARGAMERTRVRAPTRIRFGFRVREADLRFNGQGLARIEPPYRVRLDLFSGAGWESGRHKRQFSCNGL